MRLAALILSLLAWPAAATEIVLQSLSIRNGDVEVPAQVAVPPGKGPFPPLLYIHAKRGYEDPDRNHLRTLAQQGFLVLAPDWQSGRFIERWPVEHDPATETDVLAAFDALLTRADVCRGPAGVIGYSRGGYYALRLAAERPQQVAAIATYAGHMQNPMAPEAAQLFSIAPEVNQITSPLLLLIGEQDFELRRINGGRAFYALYERGIETEIQYYPLARRAFDFRLDQTPEEKIAARHARERVRVWFQRHLKLDAAMRCAR